jgi:peptidoglycan/LPS O-acetylase OafA/YrhL
LLAHRKSLYVATGFLFLGLVALTSRGYEFSAWMVTIGYSWLGLFYSGCLLIAITARSGIAQRVLCNRLLMRPGVIAYCIYLLHLPLIEASRRILGLHWNYASTTIQFMGGLVGIVLTIAIARVSWSLLEKPLLRRGHACKY